MLSWLREKIWLLVLVVFVALPVAAREIGPDGRPLGILGRDVEARFLYPAGKNFDYNCLFPIVLEYQNLSTSPQYMILKWPLDMEVPKSYKTIQLEPGAKKRLHFLLPPRSATNLYNLEVNGQNVNVGLQNNSQNPVTGLLAPKNDALDFLRGAERPAAAALPLVLHGRHAPFGAPVDALGRPQRRGRHAGRRVRQQQRVRLPAHNRNYRD